MNDQEDDLIKLTDENMITDKNKFRVTDSVNS